MTFRERNFYARLPVILLADGDGDGGGVYSFQKRSFGKHSI